MTQPNPLKTQIFDPFSTQPNPTQPAGQPNPWTTLSCVKEELVNVQLMHSRHHADSEYMYRTWGKP